MEPIAISNEYDAGQADDITMSKTDIYVTKNSIKAMPQHVHYACRGEQLAMLSLYEYVALIDVISLKKQEVYMKANEKETRGPGRLANGTFLCASCHPLHRKISRIYIRIRITIQSCLFVFLLFFRNTSATFAFQNKDSILVGKPPHLPIGKPQLLTDE